MGTTLILAGGGVLINDIAVDAVPVKVKLVDAQVIAWDKPKTDLEWAEDVKQESFDIKSTDVLNEMIASHSESLDEALKDFKKYQECPQCIKYELGQDNPSWTQTDIDNEFQNQYNTKNWGIEKLQQSIERMNKEIELRKSGLVVPDKLDQLGTPTKQSVLDKATIIREIHD